ncbi:MAG: hypothetical protein D6814_06315, partial [Calditrichaeota bacterium]
MGGHQGFVDTPIGNTQDDPLYQSERWGLGSYKIDLANGEYTVLLHFAELVYNSTGKRVFSVKLEGSTVLSNFDIFSQAGAKNALIKSFTVTVSDGTLDIDFIANIENPNIDAIEVIGAAGVATTDASGKVSREFIVGSTVGINKVRVSPLSFSATPVEFTATATAGKATKIVKISGDNQSGAAGQPLAQPLVVELRDVNDNPVANAEVNFVVTQGGGYLDVAQPMMTGADGRASVMLTVGSQGATQKVLAYAPGLTGSPISFTATATSGVAATLQKVSGDNQTGNVGSNLPNPVVVKVVDGNNQPVPDFPVDFIATAGGGSVNGSMLLGNPGLEGNYYTNAQGRGKIAPSWGGWNTDDSETHSQVAGYNSASAQRMNTTGSAKAASISQVINLARSPANGAKVMLSFYYKVSGTHNPALRVKLRKTLDSVLVDLKLPPNNNQWTHVVHYFNWDANYQPLQIHLVVQDSVIVDIDDVNLYSLTDAQGQLSSTWKLGSKAGRQEIQALASTDDGPLTNSPVTFQATANAAAASKLVEVGGNNQIGTAGQPLANPLKVKVQDAFGNPKPGFAVNFNVTKGGGKLNGNLTNYTATTGADGIASAILTLGPTTGVTNEVQASALLNGTPLAGSPITFTAEAAV